MAMIFQSRHAVPIGLLLAFAFAVGVWFVPIAPQKKAGATKAPIASWQARLSGGADAASGSIATVPPARWNPPRAEGLAGLTPLLSGLRSPPPELPAIAEEPMEDPDIEPEPISAPVVTLDWEYQGSIVSSNARAAMLQIGDRQRFVFEGDLVPDPDNPGTDPIRIVSVESLLIRAEMKGIEVRIPLASLSPDQRQQLIRDGMLDGPVGSTMLAPPRIATPAELNRQRAMRASAARGIPGGKNQQPATPVRTPARPAVRPAAPPEDQARQPDRRDGQRREK